MESSRDAASPLRFRHLLLAKDSCTGENGGIISAMELWAWDFENNSWQFPMPGYDYMKGACEALKSDPFPSER